MLVSFGLRVSRRSRRSRREAPDQRRVARVRSGQRAGVGQLELAELEPGRHRAAGERETGRLRLILESGTLRSKPAAGRHDGLKNRVAAKQSVAKAVRDESPGGIEHVHIERVARVEMPDLVRADA